MSPLRLLPQLMAVVIVVSSGVVHGIWTGRWSRSDELGTHVAALDRVPMTIGDWEGRAMPLDRRTMEHGGIAGYLMRSYENRRGGGAVTLLIVCGRPGPIAVHTPEVCYGGAGYEPSAPRAKLPVRAASSARPDEFWALGLSKQGSARPDHLRILYAWNAGGPWTASGSPRLDFAGSPALYKLYLVRQVARPDDRRPDDPSAEFLRQLLPELDKSLPRGR